MAAVIRTIGHGTLPADDFAELAVHAGINRVADIRAFPGSRRNPQYGRDELERWLPAAGIAYTWMPDLGGRRKLPDGDDARHLALRDDAFRAYAHHMETVTFTDAIDELLAADHDASTTAILCSESVWWKCHRRLVADHLVLVRDVEVQHVMHDRRQAPHPPTPGVRLDDDRTKVVYDVGADVPLA